MERDCYIGIKRDQTMCSCRGISDAACDSCRASWNWFDGTAMSWWNWESEEPNEFSCGRLSSEGWAENDCTDYIRYVCQKGTQLCRI